MAIGERIRFLRTLRRMTQKELGLAAGFPEKNASIRMAQYENGTRTPKVELTAVLAEILKVSPQALTVPDIDSAVGLMHTLFALEDRYGLTVREENGICLRVDCSKSEDAELLGELLTAWRQAASMRERGLLSAEDYDHWRYRFPAFSPSRRPERSSPESVSSLVEQYKKTES